MPRDYETPIRDVLLAWLESDGPLTAAELAQMTGFTRHQVDSCLIHSRKKYGTQFFRIDSYRRQVGVGGREAPLYAVGPDPDAVRPRMDTARDRKATQERYRQKNKALLRARDRKRRGGKTQASIFDLLGASLL